MHNLSVPEMINRNATVTVYAAAAPFTLRGEAPAYHPSTDALCGSHVWTERHIWASADEAERSAAEMSDDSDADYMVVDANGQRVEWPELGPELPPNWWSSVAYKRSIGLDDDAILF